MMILIFIILSTIISSGYGDVVDVEYSEEFFDPVGVNLVTYPNDQFVFDALPSIPDSEQRKFLFRFRVKSGGETHVALSDQYQGQNLMYDIVFGKNKNRYTAVRRCFLSQCEEIAAVLMPDALSSDRIQDLWISFDLEQGTIVVGGPKKSPALEVRPYEPFGVNELGFSTLHGTVGYWWFPHKYLARCAELGYKTGKSYRYTLPLVPHLSANSVKFTFSAKGNTDIRILLAPEVRLTDQKPAYEIIIGSASNTVSEIRRCNNAIECCPVVASAQTPNILDMNKSRRFRVIYENGLLKVYFIGELKPFLSIRDTYPISVRAIGYSQGPFNEGWVEFPVKGMTWGLLVFDTEANSPFNLELPLVPGRKAHNLELTFLVKAQHSVLIAFSPEIDINTYNGRLYEIIIGGWNNEKSAIRFCKGCGAKTKRNHLALDQSQFRQFRISIVNGKIDIYEGQLEESTLSFQDPNPLRILSVGFKTSNQATGRFVFDTCHMYG